MKYRLCSRSSYLVRKNAWTLVVVACACLMFAPPSQSAGHTGIQPTHVVYIPMVTGLRCNEYLATMKIIPEQVIIRSGSKLTVTTTLINSGCVDLGLPNHRIDLQVPAQPLPKTIASETHYLSVPPKHSDNASFLVSIADTGPITLTAVATFEVHYEGGPPVWGRSESAPVIITVVP